MPLRGFAKTLVLAVRDHADDFDPWRCSVAEAENACQSGCRSARSSAQTSGSRLRPAAYRPCPVSEVTPRQEGRSHRLEITGRDFVVVHDRSPVIRRWSFTFDIHATVAEISRTQLWMRREARRNDARQGSDILEQSRLEAIPRSWL